MKRPFKLNKSVKPIASNRNQQSMYLKVGLILLTVLFSINGIAAIYKYKDKTGKIIFTDARPPSDTETEKIKYRKKKNKSVNPIVSFEKVDEKFTIQVSNPFYAPIEIRFISSSFKKGSYSKVIPARATKKAYVSDEIIPKLSYSWRFGDPNTRPDGYHYKFPVISRKSHQISQSFRGSFSHNKRPNIYAVDIALDLGTTISAARGGTVFATRDNFHLKGQSQYFLDKANVIKILHDDGTYAIYAHILQGSSLVTPGDKVVAGEKIARSGSAGFSTGPHLHFVVRRNRGMKIISNPFTFVDSDGRSFSPKRGMFVKGNH